MTREELVDQKESLKLAVDVAVMARTDELKGFADEFIKKHGFEDFVQARVVDERNLTPSLYFEGVNTSYKIIMSFSKQDEDGNYKAGIYTRSIDYSDYFADDKPAIKKIKFLSIVADSLDEFTALVNSPAFKAYHADILMYEDSQKSIETFDEEARKARIKEVEKSFKPGMKLFNGHGKCFPVLKVTAKRVVLQGYSYSNGYPRKSEWIDNLARWIVNGSWTLQES